jgi:hypothetical protein
MIQMLPLQESMVAAEEEDLEEQPFVLLLLIHQRESRLVVELEELQPAADWQQAPSVHRQNPIDLELPLLEPQQSNWVDEIQQVLHHHLLLLQIQYQVPATLVWPVP